MLAAFGIISTWSWPGWWFPMFCSCSNQPGMTMDPIKKRGWTTNQSCSTVSTVLICFPTMPFGVPLQRTSFEEQAIRQFHGAARSIDVYKLRRDTQKSLSSLLVQSRWDIQRAVVNTSVTSLSCFHWCWVGPKGREKEWERCAKETSRMNSSALSEWWTSLCHELIARQLDRPLNCQSWLRKDQQTAVCFVSRTLPAKGSRIEFDLV